MLDSAGFITFQEKNDFWKLVLTRGSVSLLKVMTAWIK